MQVIIASALSAMMLLAAPAWCEPNINDRSKLAWQRKDDNWWVSVDGKERYFIADALIHGG